MHYMSSTKNDNAATLTVSMSLGSIALLAGSHEETRNLELQSLDRVQAKARRGGKEGAPIVDELS